MRFHGIKILLAVGIFLLISSCAGMQNVQDRFLAEIARHEGHSAYDRGQYADALAQYKKAADYNNPESQYFLAEMYMEGLGTPRDVVTGVRWMQRSADNRYAPAQVHMAMRHLAGDGVDLDPARSRQLMRRAADAQNAEAQYLLGVLIATGIGGPENVQESLRWFRLAKSNGFPVPDEFLLPEGIASLQQRVAAKAPPTKRTTPQGKDLVRRIQSGLTRLGFNPGPIDGMFGGKTAGAIRAFQEQYGLIPNGRVSPELLEMIEKTK